MAKLFCTVESDRVDKHQIANKLLEIKVFYGSKDDSKLLTHILVKFSSDLQFFQKNTVEPKPFTIEV